MSQKTTLALLFVFFTANIFAQSTILWKVSKPNNPNISYLLGTFHQMGNSFIDEKSIIRELLTRSELVTFETIEDRTEKIVQVMNSRKEDFSYKSNIDKADLEFLEKYTASWAVPLSKQKPAELLTKLQQEYVKENCGTVKPSDSWDHMDEYLVKIAKDNNIKLKGLETYEDQFDAINNVKEEEFTWDKAKEALHFWVVSLEKKKNINKICGISREYLKMKFDYQLNVQCGDKSVIERNEKWLPQITESIDGNNTFIAVGLFHLFGQCGIITMLRNKGYQVDPVDIKK